MIKNSNRTRDAERDSFVGGYSRQHRAGVGNPAMTRGLTRNGWYVLGVSAVPAADAEGYGAQQVFSSLA
jgi:hypothetical protein